MPRLEKITHNPFVRPLGAMLWAAIASGAIGLAMHHAGLSVDFSVCLPALLILCGLGSAVLQWSPRFTQSFDRLTFFFLAVAIGLPLVFAIVFALAISDYGVHGVLGTNHAFKWPVYLGEHLLLLMPGLTAGAAFFAWTAPAIQPPGPEASDDIERRLRKDWWDWFWLQPVILADIAVISSIVLGAGTLARRLSAWFAVNLITLSLAQFLCWFGLWWWYRRSGRQPHFIIAVLLIGLPFINWARLPVLQEHGPEAVGGAIGMWTLAMLSAIAINAKRPGPMVTVTVLSTVSFVAGYFLHQHADAWFEQALISLMSGAFCVALVFALHTRARQAARDQSILARALQREREANEAARRETERRHRVLRAVGHDLRQPLSALQLWLFSAERKSAEPQSELAAANAAVTSAHEILDSISQIAWMNDAEKNPRFENVSLAGLMADLAAELRLTARDACVELDCAPLAVTVRSDPLLLRRILRNFLVNAIKYGDDRVVLAAGQRDGAAEIYVADNGPGIPEEIRASIFEEFARGTREGADGFGVGLAVAKDLATALGHELFVRSETGQGSTFGLYAPIVTDPAAPS